MKQAWSAVICTIGALIFLSFGLDAVPCNVFSRQHVPKRDSFLYDSLSKIYAVFPVYKSDSVTITDTAKIRYPYLTSNTTRFYPVYLQFKGSYPAFLSYILCFDPALDSVKTCGDKVTLYYAQSCDGCDSGFAAAEQSFPFEFYYYRYHEIYAAFFSFAAINKVELMVGGVNQTYIPAVGTIPVYAPAKCMEKKWYRKETDYAKFFPADFPASVGGDFIITENDEFIWREAAANRFAGTMNKH